MSILDRFKKKKQTTSSSNSNKKTRFMSLSDLHKQSVDLSVQIKELEQQNRDLIILTILVKDKLMFKSEMLNDHSMSHLEREASLSMYDSVYDLIRRLYNMSDEKLEELNNQLTPCADKAIEKLLFNKKITQNEHKIMDMIYEEYGELINEILYGSKEESKAKVKTIR